MSIKALKSGIIALKETIDSVNKIKPDVSASTIIEKDDCTAEEVCSSNKIPDALC